MMILVAIVAVGVLAGVLSGLFGIGGGIVIVPMLALLLGFTQHKAQGTSLAMLSLPVALVAVVNYYKKGNVDLRAAALLALGFIVGAYFSSGWVNQLPQATLKRMFAVLLIAVALKIFWDTRGVR